MDLKIFVSSDHLLSLLLGIVIFDGLHIFLDKVHVTVEQPSSFPLEPYLMEMLLIQLLGLEVIAHFLDLLINLAFEFRRNILGRHIL